MVPGGVRARYPMVLLAVEDPAHTRSVPTVSAALDPDGIDKCCRCRWVEGYLKIADAVGAERDHRRLPEFGGFYVRAGPVELGGQAFQDGESTGLVPAASLSLLTFSLRNSRLT